MNLLKEIYKAVLLKNLKFFIFILFLAAIVLPLGMSIISKELLSFQDWFTVFIVFGKIFLVVFFMTSVLYDFIYFVAFYFIRNEMKAIILAVTPYILGFIYSIYYISTNGL
ncbi:hypothetical protein ACOTWR_06495 [Aliarcobacter butzleri]|uniref:hypothetical protein n=1 Tax=Aliarcobacter butzleri TaxID=28197 RepID=UPI0021B3F5B5|nr:hypothetical protein [Aliarcobacter butzleri]MCT7564141.1 hypothetical protein [Aliarcobacter butzleri]MCT7578699.1 hypothetical protein [Aliarcobacter butzleri]MCT7647645.1 hypothetical protein [Aliarcobacter butzleri]